MAEEIIHKGKVLSVDDDVVRVEIISSSACSSCHAAGLCSMSEAVRKVVEVPAHGNEGYVPDEEVTLVLKSSLGMRAVLSAYAAPLAILLVICVSMSFAGVNELYTGLAGMSAVAAYYLVLYLMRERMSRDYVFSIRKDNNLNSIK